MEFLKEYGSRIAVAQVELLQHLSSSEDFLLGFTTLLNRVAEGPQTSAELEAIGGMNLALAGPPGLDDEQQAKKTINCGMPAMAVIVQEFMKAMAKAIQKFKDSGKKDPEKK
jgi:hypothetical protein